MRSREVTPCFFLKTMPKVVIEKLVFGGQALGRLDDTIVFLWGALPGEEVEFKILKKKSNFIEGVVTQVLTPSPHRIQARDDHFLSCSPWQVMDYAYENEWKQKIALETYERIAKIRFDTIDIVAPQNAYEYRNKMEYNFFADTDGVIHAAFHHRGTHSLYPVGDCVLADAVIKQITHTVLAWINQEKIPRRSLKSMIIRSNSAGQGVVALFIKDRLTFTSRLELNETLVGAQVYLSDYRSPASVPTELLFSYGNNHLETVIDSTRLIFGLLSFFQINPPIFEKVLADIKPYVEGETVVDFYAGVGAIGLPLAPYVTKLELIEENREAVTFAQENIAYNKITNATAILARSEQATSYIDNNAVLIVDPPRTGLHPDVVAQILRIQPKRVLYLSCGIDTQARDLDLLKARYKPVLIKLFNFFPRTPHIESLCVLERL